MATREVAIARAKLSRVCINLQVAICILVSTQVGTGHNVAVIMKSANRDPGMIIQRYNYIIILIDNYTLYKDKHVCVALRKNSPLQSSSNVHIGMCKNHLFLLPDIFRKI